MHRVLVSAIGFKVSSRLTQQCCEVGAVAIFIVFIFNEKSDS